MDARELFVEIGNLVSDNQDAPVICAFCGCDADSYDGDAIVPGRITEVSLQDVFTDSEAGLIIKDEELENERSHPYRKAIVLLIEPVAS